MYDFQYLNAEGQWVSYRQSRHMDARCAADDWAYLTFQIGITPGIWDCNHQRQSEIGYTAVAPRWAVAVKAL